MIMLAGPIFLNISYTIILEDKEIWTSNAAPPMCSSIY